MISCSPVSCIILWSDCIVKFADFENEQNIYKLVWHEIVRPHFVLNIGASYRFNHELFILKQQ